MYLDTLKLYYEESKSARQQVEGLFDRYRTSTSTVLAVATAAIAFFGFSIGPRQPVFYWVAIGAYLVAAGIALWTFVPVSSRINVAYDTQRVLTQDDDNLGPLTALDIYYGYAVGHQAAFAEALENLTRQFGFANRFRALIVVVAILVLAASLSVMLGTSAPARPTHVIVERG